MNLTPRPSRNKPQGFALILTLVLIAILLASYATLMSWVNANAKITKRNILFTQTQSAAESATELVLATMMRDFNNQALNSANTYSSATNLPSQAGWPTTYQFSDTNGTPNSTYVTPLGTIGWTQLPARYNGLYGWGQTWEITSKAIPQSVGENLSASISQDVWFGSIPVFQFAIFYNMDLEINPGAAMTINGKVHANNNIYATGSGSGTPLTFSDLVEASGKVNQFASPLDPNNTSRTGNVIFSMRTNNPVNQASSLSLPVGTNNNPSTVMSVLSIPPAGTVATSPAGQSFIYNLADIIISNSPAGSNVVYYQNLNTIQGQIQVPMDATNISAGVTNVYYSFVTNVSFYDYREAKTVKAIQVDVGKFNTWLSTSVNGRTYNSMNTVGYSSKGHNIDGIYVYNSIPATSSQLPAVRLVNGEQLPPGGLSVGTPFPIYIKGNYNVTTNGAKLSTTLGDTTNTYPAAIMGDAVTILSTNWNDANTSATGLSSRTPISTTINAACLEGIVPSNGTHYSGGLENFLRLLENWNNSTTTITYNGSIVVLFQSQYATGFWNSAIYGVPKRAWGFDPNFMQQNLLPPMTPQVRATIRGNWDTQ